MKCVECFKELPGDIFICDACIEVKSNDLDHINESINKESGNGKKKDD